MTGKERDRSIDQQEGARQKKVVISQISRVAALRMWLIKEMKGDGMVMLLIKLQNHLTVLLRAELSSDKQGSTGRPVFLGTKTTFL